VSSLEIAVSRGGLVTGEADADPSLIRVANGPPRRAALGALVALFVIAVTGLAVMSSAGAAVQGFTVSPTSGPPGTMVKVSGTACSPGITVSSTQDFVRISSTTLSLATDIPVAANGSWHGTLAVPGNAAAVPGLVFAACFTDALPSLTTTYTPQGFTVTAGPAPTTTVTTPTTPKPTTPTTLRQTTSLPPSTSPGPADNGGTPTTRPVSGSTPTIQPGPGNGNNPGGSNGGAGGAPSGAAGSTTTVGKSRSPAASGNVGTPTKSASGQIATAAGLRDPDLATSRSGTDDGTAWILWLVLVAVVAGAVALSWWWQHRAPDDVS
jgi:hypothetical protein